jgi:hypothetical protein
VAIGPADVATALGIPRANVKKMLLRMERAGDVVRAGRGLYLIPSQMESRSWAGPVGGDALSKTLEEQLVGNGIPGDGGGE